ncbi:flagellar hook-associated protein FlgK [Borrelia miyamotoi]|uniref:Flagellar hook-associated protein 1 n=1 Tax=Borrelia miyamotoi TaxID=47466 RepID=A0AAP8YS46_9SPIR|nr:flagellar hook-associated protein FlgK [Borrelia miyamotoi]AHH05239.1 Flagellar hook-associated protein 1 [Borrelia miyamotoi FR64b]ATQ15011.1 flagellar hook-associated protein FlgK [Borrelia miyamotoi]ATQ16193.1 flagellar hook-associated protein FlgK [Borrelia miyamotoi]ATQ17339.1 flagellar hook-associated protein FlgK [Borrelia miyamotoi]ATQ18157.1 flagellar hook-associated protein FlgK [Borrelia miyamotoi]
MDSTFSGIEIGKKSLLAHKDAMNTVGHNLTNTSKPGYSRQRVIMKTEIPIYTPQLNRASKTGQLGQGIMIQSIERVRDDLLDIRIAEESQYLGYWKAKDKFISLLENIYNEPEEQSIRKRLNDFWDSWQDLSRQPQGLAERNIILERGKSFAEIVRNRFHSLERIYIMANDEIKITTEEINNYLRNISDLNRQIAKAIAIKDQPNDLMDERDLLVDKLSNLIGISIENRRDPNEFLIHVDGKHLIQGILANELVLEAVNGPTRTKWNVLWNNGEPANINTGKLGALINVRNNEIKNEINELNNMAINITELINETHMLGYGLDKKNGRIFFDQEYKLTDELGRYDSNGDGQFDSVQIFKINSTNEIFPEEKLGFSGILRFQEINKNDFIEIPYLTTDTVQDIISKINHSKAQVTARINSEGKFEIKAIKEEEKDIAIFRIKHIEDSGLFLTTYTGILNTSGAQGAYNYQDVNTTNKLTNTSSYTISPSKNPAAWFKVFKEIEEDPSKIVSGIRTPTNNIPIGNNKAALSIASFANSQIMIGKNETLNDYFANTASNIAIKGQIAEITKNSQEQILKSLTDLRLSISGVNKDEELASMIEFQQSFIAASKFITVSAELIDTIINKMGV